MRLSPGPRLLETQAGVWGLWVAPAAPSTAFHAQEMQPVCPDQGQCPVLESPSGVPAACREPRASHPGGSGQPWGPHSSSMASWPVAMEIHWHSSLSTPNQVRPGSTLTLGVLLETLSARSPLPLPPPASPCLPLPQAVTWPSELRLGWWRAWRQAWESSMA